MTNLLTIEPTNIDGLIKRAEIYSAAGHHAGAVADLDKAVSQTDPLYLELLFRRGLAKRSQGDLLGALADLTLSLEKPAGSDHSRAVAVHHLGNVQADLGRNLAALASFRRAIELGTSLSHVYNDIASVHMERGEWRDALHFLNLTHQSQVQQGRLEPLVLARRGLLLQNLGRHAEAIVDLKGCLQLSGQRDTQCLLLLAVCHFSSGEFSRSEEVFKRLLALDPTHYGWPRREVMLFNAQRAHAPLFSFNPDQLIPAAVRAASSKFDPADPTTSKTVYSTAGSEFTPSERFNASVKALLRETLSYSGWIQLNTTGFLPNQRSHASFGLAVLAMAQRLQDHVRAVRSGKKGLLVPDSLSSHPHYQGVQREDGTDKHYFGWRDYFDGYVRWRQLSEPMDSVWWADRFPLSSRGQSIFTLLVGNGHVQPVRYYSYFKPALQLVKELVLTRGFVGSSQPTATRYLPSSQVSAVRAAQTSQQLQAAVGESFKVVVPLLSTYQPATNISGGTLMVDGGGLNGPDLKIHFDVYGDATLRNQLELAATFERLVAALVAVPPTGPVQDEQVRDVLSRALELFYYWVNLTPLTRGSSACGYGAIYAAVLSTGHVIHSRVPRNKQLDFEAFFSLSPTQFSSRISSWLSDIRPASESLRAWTTHGESSENTVEVSVDATGAVTNTASEVLRVDEVLDSVAKMLFVLSHLNDYSPSPFFDV
eukprot:CAMPEP_0170087962 /NCGR_PEP_ID=MMETSP0019_2-20121128/22325_1 /TAXON_ID=98059 /ORGANISM="Dinobryon sp., Strain UTEXLB2267" /LENGTH=707 /DNA_ID=CAMNT_0010305907 /DNA_START=423 /DNA_END=2546 /DNA_ORIENTATION=+